MSSSGVAPAGWHPDPYDPDRAMRWWDGTRWTGHVHPVSQPAAPAGFPPAGPHEAGGYDGPPPAWTPGGYPPGPADSHRPGPLGSRRPGPFGGYRPGQWGSYRPGQWGSYRPGPFGRRYASIGGGANQASVTAIGVAALYLVLAALAHIVFIGILPVIMAVRAVQRREPLAALAVAAAVVSAVLGFTVFLHG